MNAQRLVFFLPPLLAWKFEYGINNLQKVKNNLSLIRRGIGFPRK